MRTLRKFLPFVFLYLVALQAALAQPQFQKVYGGPGTERGMSICRAIDGGSIITGSTTSSGEGLEDIFLMKTSSAGGVSWVRTYGSTGSDIPVALVATVDSCYLVTGYYVDPLTGWDMFLMKVGADGTLLWAKRYGGYGADIGEYIHPHPDGGYLIVATGESYGEGGWDAWLMRVDEGGDVVWFKTYGSSATEQAYFASPTSDNGFIVAAHTWGYGAGMHDVILIKVTVDGTFQWMRSYGTTADDGGAVAIQTQNGGYLVAASTHGSDHGGRDCLILTTDSLGNLLSANARGLAGDDILNRGLVLDDARLALTGWTTPSGGALDGWFAVVGEDGSFEQSQRFGGGGTEQFAGLYRDVNDAFVLLGTSTSAPAIGYDAYLIRTDSTGTTQSGSYPGLDNPIAVDLVVGSPSPELHSYELASSAAPFVQDSASFIVGTMFSIEPPQIFIPHAFGRASDTVSVPVKITGPAGIAGGDFSVSFDTTILTPLSVRKGSLTQDFALAFNVSRPDSILISFARAQGIEGNDAGSLFIIDCAVNAEIPDSVVSAIVISSAHVYDENADLLEVGITNGTFTTHTGHKGDVNADLHVNAADAILCLRIAALLESTDDHRRWAADYDGDGDVTTFDATGILRESVGLSPIPFEGVVERTVIIRVPPISALSGAEVKAPISISGFPDMMSGSIDFAVDPALLEAQSVSTKPLFDGILAFGTPQSGLVRVAFASSESWNQQDAVLAEMAFVAKANVFAFTPSITSAKFFDKFGRVSSTFQLITTGLQSDESVPATLLLEQNYPNPFNPVTTIDFSLPSKDRVVLSVFDVLGRKVRTLIDGEMSAGPHTIRFDGASLPSGVYFYTLTSGTATARRSMLLLK